MCSLKYNFFLLQVIVTSTSLEHAGESGELSADVALPGVRDIILAKTFVTFSKLHAVIKQNMNYHFVYLCSLSLPLPPSLSLLAGSVLCATGLERCQVKVFAVTTSLVWSNEFTLSVQLATELHQMSSVSGGWSLVN